MVFKNRLARQPDHQQMQSVHSYSTETETKKRKKACFRTHRGTRETHKESLTAVTWGWSQSNMHFKKWEKKMLQMRGPQITGFTFSTSTTPILSEKPHEIKPSQARCHEASAKSTRLKPTTNPASASLGQFFTRRTGYTRKTSALWMLNCLILTSRQFSYRKSRLLQNELSLFHALITESMKAIDLCCHKIC